MEELQQRLALMAPKLRRPAAAKGAAKAASKAAVVGPKRFRRPAGAGLEGEAARGAASVEDRFLAGELLKASQAPVRPLSVGILLVVEGEYWGGDCKLCGAIQSVRTRGPTDVELSLAPEGTTHEELLKWVSGNPGKQLRIHLCGGKCDAKVEAHDLIHAKKVKSQDEEKKRRRRMDRKFERYRGRVGPPKKGGRGGQASPGRKRTSQGKKKKK